MTTQTQSRYLIQTATSAPEAAQPLLANVEKAFGYVPNTLGTMANSPTTLKSYIEISAIFSKSSFTPVEQQISPWGCARTATCN